MNWVHEKLLQRCYIVKDDKGNWEIIEKLQFHFITEKAESISIQNSLNENRKDSNIKKDNGN